MNFIRNPIYLSCSMLYGAVRKFWDIKDATVERECKRVPMLVRDKAFITMEYGLMSPWIWPIYLYCDAGKIELIMRSEYKKQTYNHAIDYLFTF